MSSTLILDRKNKDFEKKIEKIKSSKADICKNTIGKDFYNDALNECDLLIVNIVNEEVKGFACVNFIHDDDSEKGLYIDLICNLEYHPMKTRQDYEKLKGKDIINSIINYGNSNGYKYVSLSAIESVITYYWYLGFRFDDRSPLSEKADLRLNELLSILKKKNTPEEDKEAAANEIFKKYSGEFYSENKQSMSQLSIKQRVNVVKENGILMVKYLHTFGGKNRKSKKKGKHLRTKKRNKKKKQKTMKRKMNRTRSRK